MREEVWVSSPGIKAIPRTTAAKRLDTARLGWTAVGCRASARTRQTVLDDLHIPRIGRLGTQVARPEVARAALSGLRPELGLLGTY
jgi:hypothetical protein